MSKLFKSKSQQIPSLKLSILIIIIYLFLIIPLVAGIMYVLVWFGYPTKNIKSNLSEVMLIVQICLILALTYYLFKRYSNYLLSDCWKAKFINYLSVGLKWSTPILILHIISLIIPSMRGKLIEDYLSMKIIMVKGISNFSLIIFSIWMILGAIFEEFYFRGIILQKLRGRLNRTLSVFIAAGLFALAHFIFSSLKIGDLANILLVGLLCGFAFTSTGSCISAIVPHLINNIICIGFVSIIR